jgi:hypothetical protein
VEPVISNIQYYGQRRGENGHVIAIAIDEERWTVAVAYGDGTLVVVPEPELYGLMSEARSLIDLVTLMGRRLGMVNQTIDHRAAAGIISLATLIADVNDSGCDTVIGRGRLHSIDVAA